MISVPRDPETLAELARVSLPCLRSHNALHTVDGLKTFPQLASTLQREKKKTMAILQTEHIFEYLTVWQMTPAPYKAQTTG